MLGHDTTARLARESFAPRDPVPITHSMIRAAACCRVYADAHFTLHLAAPPLTWICYHACGTLASEEGLSSLHFSSFSAGDTWKYQVFS